MSILEEDQLPTANTSVVNLTATVSNLIDSMLYDNKVNSKTIKAVKITSVGIYL